MSQLCRGWAVAERLNGLLTMYIRRGEAEPYVHGKINSPPNSVAARLHCIPRHHHPTQSPNVQPYVVLWCIWQPSPNLVWNVVAPRLNWVWYTTFRIQTVRLRLPACMRLTGRIVAPRHAIVTIRILSPLKYTALRVKQTALNRVCHFSFCNFPGGYT